MRANVFTDRSLTRQAGRFVWLAIDTEKAKNAAIRKRLKIPALPTYFIVDPRDEHVALRWVGGATVAQLEKILDDGAASVVMSSGAGRPSAASRRTAVVRPFAAWESTSVVREVRPAVGSAVERALARADRFFGAGEYPQAAAAYQEALLAAPASWPSYARAVESLMFALGESDQAGTLVGVARAAWPRLRSTPSAANLAGTGLDAALRLPDSLATRKASIAEFEARCREVLTDRSLILAGDDRSGVYIALLDAREDAKDEAGRKQVAEEWARMLEGEAAKANTPDARAVYDSHRVSAYLALGQPERAIPMLEASERDLPADYNPPARLAVAYRAMKRWSDALAASNRAFAKAYGPRQLGMYQVRTDIYLGLADTTAARRTLQDAVAFADSLPPGQRADATLAALRKRLDGLGRAATP